MNIISRGRETRQFLSSLCHAVQRDAYSWRDWVVLHLSSALQEETALPTDAQDKLVAATQKILQQDDGAILHLGNHTHMILLRAHKSFDRDGFLAKLNAALGITVPQQKVEVVRISENPERMLKMVPHTMRGIDEKAVPIIVPDAKPVEWQRNLIKTWMKLGDEHCLPARPRVMVVEDDIITRRIVSHTLKRSYPMVTAQTAKAGICQYLLNKPDMVFLDLELPDGHGFEVLEYIHRFDPKCHVVVFTGNAYLENHMHAMAAGASGFLKKPFNRRDFDHYIQNWKMSRAAAHQGGIQ